MSEAESLFGLKPLTVRELNERVKSCLEERFEWVAVAGEIADLARPRSGHVYFTLREADAQVRAVMWKGVSARQRTPLADGMQVIALGSLTVYPPRGVYQLVVSEVVPRGLGDIRRALEALRKKLEGEGLFDPARKKALPCLPFRLAVITSATGAAVQDILRTALSRFPQLVVRVFPVRVQGVNAPAEIVRALALANTPGAADVILLGRGGGSLDDLWAFNHEEVVRAVAASRLPVISCIGHETDTTLSDLAADVRASTPTRAAELAVPVLADLVERLGALRDRGWRAVRRLYDRAAARLELAAAGSALRDPVRRVREAGQRLDELHADLLARLCETGRRAYNECRLRWSRLESLSPRATLARGFTVTRRVHGRIVRSVAELAPGQEVEILLVDGACRALVAHVGKERCDGDNGREHALPGRS